MANHGPRVAHRKQRQYRRPRERPCAGNGPAVLVDANADAEQGERGDDRQHGNGHRDRHLDERCVGRSRSRSVRDDGQHHRDRVEGNQDQATVAGVPQGLHADERQRQQERDDDCQHHRQEVAGQVLEQPDDAVDQALPGTEDKDAGTKANRDGRQHEPRFREDLSEHIDAEGCEQRRPKGEQDRAAAKQRRRQPSDKQVAPSVSEQGLIADRLAGNDGLEVGKGNEPRDQERDHVHGLQCPDVELADGRGLPADIARHAGQHDGNPGSEGDSATRQAGFSRKQHQRRPGVADGQHWRQDGWMATRPDAQIERDADAGENDRLDGDQHPHGARLHDRGLASPSGCISSAV